MSIGSPQVRADAVAKVTGVARYAADHRPPGMLHARLVTSTIARGLITSIDASDASGLPGVRAVITHHDLAGELNPVQALVDGGHFHTAACPLAGPVIRHAGQIVALVVAETGEVAERAAHAVDVRYATGPAVLDLADTDPADDVEVARWEVGDRMPGGAVAVDEVYTTPAQHHHAIELYAVLAQWRGASLEVDVPTQWVQGEQRGLAAALGVPESAVRVRAPYVGGGFGGKAVVLWHTVLVAWAARRLAAPVRLFVTRQQCATVASFRPQSTHRVRLTATSGGRLLGYEHDVRAQTSRTDTVGLAGTAMTARLYATSRIRCRETVAPVDAPTPGFMRAPAEFGHAFALESAVDELAARLQVDPVALRLRNEPARDPVTRLPFGGRHLSQCLRLGAELFGWADRDPRPRSMSDAGELIGWGCAASLYPANGGGIVECRMTLDEDGRAVVEVAATDLGTGAATVLAQIAADAAGLDPGAVVVTLGDSVLPAGLMAAGSCTTGSAGSAVYRAGLLLRAALERGESAPVTVTARWVPRGMTPALHAAHRRGSRVQLGPVRDGRVLFAYGAQFAEVRVDPVTGMVRVPRVVGVFDAGRIVNPRTARAQLVGGITWGIGHAIMERTPIDRSRAAFSGTDLGACHVATHADVGQVRVEMLDIADPAVNPLGVKGVGEIGLVGTVAAVTNAVYHATGVRVRRLPVEPAVLVSAR
ncbi:xanthine dehydrogenase family protein molybdopterin-binding subunit [Prauserella muralis]|nr:xanthine dehydrogenase family protein molybdopterin-binding subunit [Prauserella muralis]TWE28824.1 xanthine dehydrogenase YagR molybdenum-binding subunit [Prauserella muralis]